MLQPLRLTRRTFTGALPDASDRGQEENLAVLPVPLCDSQSENAKNGLSLSGMLDTWFYENVASGLRRKVTGFEQVGALVLWHFLASIIARKPVSPLAWKGMLTNLPTAGGVRIEHLLCGKRPQRCRGRHEAI